MMENGALRRKMDVYLNDLCLPHSINNLVSAVPWIPTVKTSDFYKISTLYKRQYN